MKKFCTALLCGALLAQSLFATGKEDVKDGTILHCWCWSFKTIKDNMQAIKDAGFTAIQTSPANECIVGEKGGMELFSTNNKGKWYYHYQPTDMKIGNYQLGTRDDFIEMCDAAKANGISVIVDIIANHTATDKGKVSKALIEACGGPSKIYHTNEKKGCEDYNDRLQCTTYTIGGLPDINTENPLFQAYFLNYLNDLVSCGASGFRIDTAKHIGLPDDPTDPSAKVNNFWPVVTGQESVNGVSLKNKDNLFIYGEVLQDQNSRESAYAKFVGVTASGYGYKLRRSCTSHIFDCDSLRNWSVNNVSDDKIITWVESHDTYANEGQSASLKNFEIRSGWALIASRKGGTPLFFNRPKGEEGRQFPGASKIGDTGNDEYKNSEVVAVNKFRTAMRGEDEELINGNDRKMIIVKRGKKGVVIINANKDTNQKVSIPVSLPDGSYTDKAHGLPFKVKGGKLTGDISKEQICVIY